MIYAEKLIIAKKDTLHLCAGPSLMITKRQLFVVDY